jgi:hypothetical protein
LSIVDDKKLFGLILRNFDNEEHLRSLMSILTSRKLSLLIQDVRRLYNSDEIIFEIEKQAYGHGAFDPMSNTPRILINSQTGLNESLIAHELIHAIQMKEGFISSLNGIYQDKRETVIIYLNSNILHIPLVRTMKERGFSIKKYFAPTLFNIKRGLEEIQKETIYQRPFIRVHYESAAYLRLNYEATYLSMNEKYHFYQLFKRKSPVAASLGDEMVTIIDKCNPLTPRGNIRALYECLKLINSRDLSQKTSGYFPGAYSAYIQNMEKYDLSHV